MSIDLPLTEPSPLSPLTLMVNLLIGTALSMILGWHFVTFAQTLGNRTQLARILPFVALTTVVVISVVKSSLALSLGLVGALSIVRFRTPIKEPEELAYIFLAIAIGLALGADQRLPVVIACAVILPLMAARRGIGGRRRPSNLYLNVELPVGDGGDNRLAALNALVTSSTRTTDVRRIDVGKDYVHATYFVDCASEQQVLGLLQGLRSELPDATVSLVDSGGTVCA